MMVIETAKRITAMNKTKTIDHTKDPLAALHRACAKGEPIIEIPAVKPEPAQPAFKQVSRGVYLMEF